MKNSRILLCRLGGIGDVIHTLPLVKYLKKKFENASIEYITSQSVADLLLNCCSYIDKVWVFNKYQKKQLAKELVNIDYFFNLHNSLSFFFFNLLYIRAKKYFQYKKNLNFHAAINFAQTYDPLISAFSLDSKTLFVNDCKDILNKYNLKEGRYLCFVPGVGKIRPHRAWHLDNWIDLTRKFLTQGPDCKVVFLGGEDELYLVDYLPSSNNQTLNLIGKLSLHESAKIISKADLLISCDTGLLHLASAIGIKTIGLYGPTLSKRSGPFSTNYDLLTAKNCKCINNFKDLKRCKVTKELSGYCMNSLSVDEVLSLTKVLSYFS